MIERVDTIHTLLNQVSAILELMRSTEDAETGNINVAADMCMTMLDEVAICMESIENEWKEKERGAKDEK